MGYSLILLSISMKSMDQFSVLTANDGHTMSAYISQPNGQAKGAVIILHEIFGITAQIQELADKFSAEGYMAVVPALFDRVASENVIDYESPAKGLELVAQCSQAHLLEDIRSAIQAVGELKVTVIGYCWGGGLAYLAACHLPVHSAVSFYGTRLLTYLNAPAPQCPMQFHFASNDSHTPPDMISKLKAALSSSDYKIYTYENAGHAFANNHRNTFNEEVSELSFTRVLALLNIGQVQN